MYVSMEEAGILHAYIHLTHEKQLMFQVVLGPKN